MGGLLVMTNHHVTKHFLAMCSFSLGRLNIKMKTCAFATIQHALADICCGLAGHRFAGSNCIGVAAARSSGLIMSREDVAMQKIKVDPALGEKLAGLRNQAVIHDEQGRVLGYFSPMKEPTRLEDMQLEPPHSIEEIEELRKKYAGKRPEEVGKPLKQILKELGY
jgi:hypothetical protein